MPTTAPTTPHIRAALAKESFCGSPWAVVNKIPAIIKQHTAITVKTVQKLEITIPPNSATVVGKAKTVVGKINMLKRKIMIKNFFIV
jgi:hypothetical protein